MGRGGRNGSGATGQSVSEGVMPAEESAYYAELEAKHFSDQATGSRFLGGDMQSLLDSNPQLLSSSDDRDEFLRLGVPEEALLPGRSYFLLRAPGEEGIVAADKLEPETPVEIIRAKAGSLSFVVRGPGRQPTQIATAIVGDYPRDPSRRALITIFPGLPAEPQRSSVSEENDLDLEDGQTISLGQLQEKMGREDLLLQIANKPGGAPTTEMQ